MNHHPTKKQRERLARKQKTISEAQEGDAAKVSPGYLQRNGIPLGLVAGGVGAVVFPQYFWAAIACIIFGLTGVAVDVWRQIVLPKRSKTSKSIFIAVCSVIVLAFGIWVFLPIPFEFSVRTIAPKYGPNSTPFGIPWINDFSELRFTLRNKSDVDYENFDAEITTDLTFEGMKQIDGIAPCAIAPARTAGRPTSQFMTGGVPVGPVNTTVTNYVIAEVLADGEVVYTGDTARKYRIRCDKLPGKSEIHFFAALSAIKPIGIGQHPETLRSPAKAADWCTIRAKFTQLGRPRSFTISECKAGHDCQP